MLEDLRENFHIPTDESGRPLHYFSGNSLGLQPKQAAEEIAKVLKGWENQGANQWFDQEDPWYTYSDSLCIPLAELVGARSNEVTIMNSLTVNMHLLLATFYKPTPERHQIIVDAPVFPSDLYALQSQIRFHGYDLKESLILLEPREGEYTLREEDIFARLKKYKDSAALLWLNGVNYLTGQLFPMERLIPAAQAFGMTVGLDLAHAIGNIPLQLHAWGADFAVWCHYKYLNSGPGAVGGAFVHEKHTCIPQFQGWWGCDPNHRFDMEDFVPADGAHVFQLSTPSILSVAPLKASLDLFSQVPFADLRVRSVELTNLLEELLRPILGDKAEVITPKTRGAQLSIIVYEDPLRCLNFLRSRGIICDFRKPNVLRFALVSMYNTVEDVEVFAEAFVDFFR